MKEQEVKFEVRNSTISGKGLFALKPINKDEVVVVWNPRVLSKQEASKLSEDERSHYTYPDGDKILLMQPPERYMNHSCEPNTHVEGRSDVASRDIACGEEITSDYLDLETEGFKCTCGNTICRSIVH